MKNECPFCNPNVITKSFANESGYYALYSHAPVTPGHSLIIPYKHVTDVFSMPENEYIELFKFARKTMMFLNTFFKTNEFDISLQQGINAGQSVEHLHLHLIPRKMNDLPAGIEWYQRLNENQLITLDSKLLLEEGEFNRISEDLRKAWISEQF